MTWKFIIRKGQTPRHAPPRIRSTQLAAFEHYSWCFLLFVSQNEYHQQIHCRPTSQLVKSRRQPPPDAPTRIAGSLCGSDPHSIRAPHAYTRHTCLPCADVTFRLVSIIVLAPPCQPQPKIVHWPTLTWPIQSIFQLVRPVFGRFLVFSDQF